MNKKNHYIKPSVKVVNLQVQGQLLAGSEEKPAASNLKSYNWNEATEE